MSPLLIFSNIKLPSGTAKSTEPMIHIRTANHNEKCGTEPKKIPIIGTNKTYKLVKKPALVASLFFFDPIPFSNGFSNSTMLLLPVAPVLVTPVAPVDPPVDPLAPVNELRHLPLALFC